MALLLAIETTTKNCSVALFENSNLLQLKEQISDEYSHAEQLTLFIEEVVKKSDKKFPVTTNISDRGLWLPSSVTLKEQNIIKISKLIKKFFQ